MKTKRMHLRINEEFENKLALIIARAPGIKSKSQAIAYAVDLASKPLERRKKGSSRKTYATEATIIEGELATGD